MVLRRSKPLALTCSLALLGGLLFAQWHRATEIHRYCAKHGQLVHSHDLDGEDDHDHETGRRGDPQRSVLLAAGDDLAHGEHGCAALDFLSHGSSLVNEASSLILSLLVEDPPRVAGEQLALASDRYRLCPKTSPPRV